MFVYLLNLSLVEFARNVTKQVKCDVVRIWGKSLFAMESLLKYWRQMTLAFRNLGNNKGLSTSQRKTLSYGRHSGLDIEL
jgi:hypothetical protein